MPNLIRRVLLNAFQSPTGTIRNHKKQSPLGRQLELLEDRVVPATFVVNSIATKLNAGAPTGVETATLNDYTLINNVFDLVSDGDTIVLNGTFDWTKPFAKASWALGSDGTSGTVLDDTNDDYSIYIPPNLDNITFTAAAPVNGKYTAIIKGPGDLTTVDSESFLYFDQSGTNQGWTISNLEIQNFDVAIGMYNTTGGVANAYAGTTITNNKILMAKDVITASSDEDLGSNVAILVGVGTNQTISNNTITIAGTGVSSVATDIYATTIGIEVQTTGGALYDGLQILGNTITVTGVPNATNPEIIIGVSENSFATGSNITISGNSFTQNGAASQAKNFDTAFLVSSHSDAIAGTTVTYANNTIFGANRGFEWVADQDFSAGDAVQLIGNNISNTFTGVLVRSEGAAYLSGNTIAAGGTNSTGVLVQDGGRLENPATGAAVEENIITGAKFGIQIDNNAGTIGSINNNGLFGNTTNVLTNLGSSIDVDSNWWGTQVAANFKITGSVNPVSTAATALTAATSILGIDEFDFQTTASNPNQSSSIGALATTGYTADRSYGWTSVSGLAGFQNSAVSALTGNPLSYELRDGVFRTVAGTSGAKTFRIDFATADPVLISAFLGNGVKAYNGLKVEFSADGSNFTTIPPITNITVAANTYTTVTSTAITPGNVGGKNSVFVRFSDATSSQAGWAVAGIKVIPTASVGALTVTSPFGSAQVADGATIDTFTVTGATPGALLTVSTTLGTIVSPDASKVTAGIQVVADFTGTASIQLRRPFLDGTATVTATDVSGASTADSVTQAYNLAKTTGYTMKFDMNSSSSANGPSLPGADWINVQNNTVFSSALGYGWNTSLTGTDNPANLPPGVTDFDDQSLFRDYNTSTSATYSTFTVFVGQGQAASVKIYTYSSNPAQNPVGMTASASGPGGTQATLTAGNNYLTVTGVGDEYSGLLTIMVAKGTQIATGNVAWVVNGMEVELIAAII